MKSNLMKKKIISVLLVICLCLMSSNLVCFAGQKIETGENHYLSSDSKTNATERQEMHENIKEQLEKQGAMDQYTLFAKVFDGEFDQAQLPYSNSSKTYSAPNGGYIKAHDNQVEMVNQYLTASEAQDVYNKTHSYGLEEAVATLAATVLAKAWAGAGYMMTLAGVVGSLMDSYMWSRINLNVDPVLICTTYDKLDDKTTTVISKWNNYPIMTNDLSFIGHVTHGKY